MASSPTSMDTGALQGSAVAKWEYVRDQIAAAVRNGEYLPGQRLPSERDLAARFNVSYMTARRAVTDLVESHILERRDRSGTYVAHDAAVHKRTRLTINLICSAYDSPGIDEFVSVTSNQVAELGWSMNLLRVSEDHQQPAAQAIREQPASIVLLHDLYPWQSVRSAIAEARDKVVIIGSRLDHLGVCSVQSDDACAMRLAVSHLQELGHTRIGYLLHDYAKPASQLRIAIWRSCFPDQTTATLNRRLIRFVVPPFRNQAEHAYEALKAYLASPQCDLTALVCQNNEVAVGALAACRDADQPVPADISLVTLGDTAVARLSEPALTSVDYDRTSEVQCALKMLDDIIAGRLPEWDRLRLTTPRLICRKSTAAPSTA